jgi:hypothetical protein
MLLMGGPLHLHAVLRWAYAHTSRHVELWCRDYAGACVKMSSSWHAQRMDCSGATGKTSEGHWLKLAWACVGGFCITMVSMVLLHLLVALQGLVEAPVGLVCHGMPARRLRLARHSGAVMPHSPQDLATSSKMRGLQACCVAKSPSQAMYRPMTGPPVLPPLSPPRGGHGAASRSQQTGVELVTIRLPADPTLAAQYTSIQALQ